MRKIFIYIMLLLLFASSAFFTVSCVTPIDFAGEEEQFVAVSGVISNNPQERRITFFENVSTSDVITGELFKNGEFLADLITAQRRTLQIPPDVIIEEGATYHIRIEKSNGEVYQSEPQEVLRVRKPEGLKTTILEQTLQLENGGFLEGFALNVLAEMPVTDQTTPYFLRFQMDESWEYQEVPDPRVDPRNVDSVHYLCYISRDIRSFPSQVWASSGLELGTQDAFVASRFVDQSFLQKHYFNVYTYPIDPETFIYYQNVQKISENTGTLLDEIPAAIEGNIFNVDDEKEIVYGFVEFAIPDTTRIFVNGLNLTINDNCEGPNPCPMPRPFIPLPLCPCADCLLLEGASYDKPEYFE